MQISDVRKFLERKKLERDITIKSISALKKSIKLKSMELERQKEGQLILQTVSSETQLGISLTVNDMITTALQSILGEDAYEFQLEFEIKRGISEAVIAFIKNDSEFDPIDDVEGGVIVTAAWIARIAMWSVSVYQTRPLFIADEPFIRLKGKEFPRNAGLLLKTISEELGIQIILASHTAEINSYAAKVFSFSSKQGISTITSEESTNE